METETALAVPLIGSDRVSQVARLLRNRLVLGGIALALLVAGAAWQWNWLVALGVAPLLLSVAPCAAMCAFGLCMHRMGGRACNTAQPGPATLTAPEHRSAQQER